MERDEEQDLDSDAGAKLLAGDDALGKKKSKSKTKSRKKDEGEGRLSKKY